GVGGEGVRQRNHAHGAGAVVVGAVPDFRAADAIVIVVPAKQNGFGLELRVAAPQQTGNVVGFAGADGNVAVMQCDLGVRQGLRLGSAAINTPTAPCACAFRIFTRPVA